ncbi:DUF4882 family protein [Acinetobacter sp. TY2]|uniref:DUF4882 family protein n=1 Tax=Acinetobacter sp. TY2 TaxID=3387403 RepID=UPI0039177048
MKKVLLGLLAITISVNSWSACTYAFDSTQAEFNEINNNPNLEFFPISSGQKHSMNLIAGTAPSPKTGYGYMAQSSAFINNKKLGIKDGDKDIFGTGVVAYEYKLKVPTSPLGSKGWLALFPTGSVSYLKNGETFDATIFYHNQSGKNELSVSLVNGSNSAIKTINVGNTADGFQKVGIYINQNSHQVGLIINNINYGYILTLSDKVKNTSYVHSVVFHDIEINDANKPVSIELVTNRSNFSFTYPTGTTDICGT